MSDSDRSECPRVESPPLRKPSSDTRRSGHSAALAVVRRSELKGHARAQSRSAKPHESRLIKHGCANFAITRKLDNTGDWISRSTLARDRALEREGRHCAGGGVTEFLQRRPGTENVTPETLKVVNPRDPRLLRYHPMVRTLCLDTRYNARRLGSALVSRGSRDTPTCGVASGTSMA